MHPVTLGVLALFVLWCVKHPATFLFLGRLLAGIIGVLIIWVNSLLESIAWLLLSILSPFCYVGQALQLFAILVVLGRRAPSWLPSSLMVLAWISMEIYMTPKKLLIRS